MLLSLSRNLIALHIFRLVFRLVFPIDERDAAWFDGDVSRRTASDRRRFIYDDIAVLGE